MKIFPSFTEQNLFFVIYYFVYNQLTSKCTFTVAFLLYFHPQEQQHM